MSRIVNLKRQKKKVSGYLGLGDFGGKYEVTTSDYKISYWGDENVGKLIMVRAA